jgi:hypothetical protein
VQALCSHIHWTSDSKFFRFQPDPFPIRHEQFKAFMTYLKPMDLKGLEICHDGLCIRTRHAKTRHGGSEGFAISPKTSS